MDETFYWYDLETFGRNPAWDKVAQFAGIRTDREFNIIGEPLVLYCKITPDYIPDPTACFITGITPQKTLAEGISEYDFIKRIDKEFSKPGTCVVGYNSINFDDEFIRNLYYRNFKDPYIREWSRGNSRWDIINLVRGVHDFRPKGLEWIKNSDGKPSFRLEELSKINGITHTHAHDALSDVEATIGIAKKIYEKQPRFFNFCLKLKKKDVVKKHIDIFSRNPFYHTSGMFTSVKGCTTMLVPLAVDPVNRNSIICYDLRFNPEDLLNLSSEEIKKLLFNKGEKKVHLKCVHINKSPMVAPLGTLNEEQSIRLGIDNESCFKHLDMIKQSENLTQKVLDIYTDNSEYTTNQDPDFQIYSGGFFRDEDKAKFTLIHNTREEDLPELKLNFMDARIPEMFWRFICRNYPDSLTKEELEKWRSFCATRVLYPPGEELIDINRVEKELNSILSSKDTPTTHKPIAVDVLGYIEILKKKMLS